MLLERNAKVEKIFEPLTQTILCYTPECALKRNEEYVEHIFRKRLNATTSSPLASETGNSSRLMDHLRNTQNSLPKALTIFVSCVFGLFLK
ncbi:hypothetical protein CEXT_71511 [Caerostris extrusa]|uniref:Uncharacterized protein n=1 Tax=Caerostris extrusa TaxID=172846 RepID=A0AAV4Y6F2_CAEEX|nr:hypothetical protein CEXT_71511 [Caerostris extrusa]